MRRKQNGNRRHAGAPPQRAKAASRDAPAALGASRERGDLIPPLIVGLGASAGGLDAFKAFLIHMPPRSGMAFVLVQHLDPHHKSLLVELLGKSTKMPVLQAEDGLPVAPDHIYVIPPNAVLTIEGGVLGVTKPAALEHRMPINLFFASLAEDQEDNAVAIILSGTGSDGSNGLKAIKAHGGVTLAQAGPDGTAMQGMPGSAAATGLIDAVLRVEAMPAWLESYRRDRRGMGDRQPPTTACGDTAKHLATICALLRSRLGHDFSEYKESTLVRRVERRMKAVQIDAMPAYIEHLRGNAAEIDLLFRDLLIRVTQFFRNPEAFAALEKEVIPRLLENKHSSDQVRIWVPGCATGEEAYTIAILVKEAMIRLEVAPKIQIFASDLDENAVTVARHGHFRKPLLGISPKRLERWFFAEGNEYCVAKDVREMCVYSTHNLIKDPPFSKLDLISCRNVLIYLDAALQARLMRNFHYALRPDGFLFLGLSEGIARQSGFFSVLDKKRRIFQRRDALVGSLAAAQPVNDEAGQPMQVPRIREPAGQATGNDVDRRLRHALEKYSPACIIIDRQDEVVRFSGRVGPYIEPSAGAASLNLFSILRKDLLPTVRAAVRNAFTTGRQVDHEDIVVAVNGNTKSVDLVVDPILSKAEEPLYVVAFQERGSNGTRKAAPAAAGGAVVADEPGATRAQLQTMIDELETTNEELMSSNEEYQSVNEEFQSANEELESAKEELQSLNEELQTINGELASKNDTLAEAHSDIKNLLDSTQIPTLFLDDDLRIRSFTPALSAVFHVRPGDHGRPITDIVSRLSYVDLKRDVNMVLHSLSIVEREVAAVEDGTTYLMRIRPYRTVSNVVQGVVITFIDVTERKRHEEERARLAAIIESSLDAIIGHSLDGTITSWNRGAAKIFGYTADEAIGKPLSLLLPEALVDDVPAVLQRLSRGERVEHFEIDRLTKSGTRVDLSLTISPVLDDSGTMIAASTIARDASERKRSDNLRALMINELNHRVKNTLATVQSIAARSLKGGADPQSRENFDARLIALSQTHELLARESWVGVSLRELLLMELEPYRSEEITRFVVEGLDLELNPKAALALGMTFHELATNAAKYGALSASSGEVRIAWEVLTSANPGALRMTWTESGGPPVKEQRVKGFGSTLIERGLSHELDGNVRMDFRPDGLVCTIEIPPPFQTKEVDA